MHEAIGIDDLVGYAARTPAVALATGDPSEHSGPGAGSVAASDLARLSSMLLTKRLVEYAGEERAIVAAFLQHLDEFDRRRGYLDAGHGCLWDYCLRVLHLREGAAGRRIGAMRAARRFPKIIDAIRDGRLCLSTVTLLSPVLTDENFDELAAQAAFKTKAEVEHLVASLRPRSAPLDGIRRLPVSSAEIGHPSPRHAVTGLCNRGAEPLFSDQNLSSSGVDPAPVAQSTVTVTVNSAAGPAGTAVTERSARTPAEAAPFVPARARAESAGAGAAVVTPLARDSWSVRFTIDGEGKAELELLQALLSHRCGRNLASVMREAIRCAIDKHGKRRGVAPPRRAGHGSKRHDRPSGAPRVAATPDTPAASGTRTHSRTPAGPTTPQGTASSRRDTIPAEVRRAVYERDGGTCSYVAPDGQRCDSRWKLEFDHVLPAFLDGPPTVENIRLVCRAHNVHHAEQVFGRDHMERFRRRYSVEGFG